MFRPEPGGRAFADSGAVESVGKISYILGVCDWICGGGDVAPGGGLRGVGLGVGVEDGSRVSPAILYICGKGVVVERRDLEIDKCVRTMIRSPY